VILSRNRNELISQLAAIREFLSQRLELTIHPNKIVLKAFASGIDFLGWVNFPAHRVLRTTTKRRLFKRFCNKNKQSYLGLLKHGNTYKLQRKIIDFDPTLLLHRIKRTKN
jgi:hypothetical protein